MNPEDIMRSFNTTQQNQITITVEQVDEFINRCCKEKNEVLYSLRQSLQWALQQAPVLSIPEAQVYPSIIIRIGERINAGET